MSTTIQPGHAPTTKTIVARKYTPGKRRFSIYWTWSYPWEANRDATEMDNRFSTMTEVRRVAWPAYETPEWSADALPPGNRRHAGAVPPLHALASRRLAGEATGHPVAVFQRIDQAGYKLPIDERILADTDTLMVFGLDHLAVRAGGGAGGDRSASASGSSAKEPACCSRRITMSASPTT